jgi:hypothetical protein
MMMPSIKPPEDKFSKNKPSKDELPKEPLADVPPRKPPADDLEKKIFKEMVEV